jgi:hypothetical protein
MVLLGEMGLSWCLLQGSCIAFKGPLLESFGLVSTRAGAHVYALRIIH